MEPTSSLTLVRSPENVQLRADACSSNRNVRQKRKKEGGQLSREIDLNESVAFASFNPTKTLLPVSLAMLEIDDDAHARAYRAANRTPSLHSRMLFSPAAIPDITCLAVSYVMVPNRCTIRMN